MKKIMFLLSIVAILSLFVLGCTPKAPQTAPQQPIAPLPAEDAPAVEEPVVEETAPAEETEVVSENVVEITSSGFSPKVIIIPRGETVKFVNKDSAEHRPASNVHPLHTAYPGSNINNCGTADEVTTFDACKSLAEGEEYSFTFTHAGSWPYHDHLHPGVNGVVTVK